MAMTIEQRTAAVALEWWRSGGRKSSERLIELVAHFAAVNGVAANVREIERIALEARNSWELDR